ncbi:MAG: LysR family transcriptional regulator [Betaproteobacteria bacterium]|nr:MAG: LysR family transcriptional regulator [Betaproteobacteria bacterium]
MDLKQLQYFTQIANLGSFSRASGALDIAQPALSRQIGLLEAELGAHVFVRHGRGVRLTDRGRLLLEHATGILHQCDRALAAMRSKDAPLSGRIAVGLPPSLCRLLAVPLLQQLRQRFPELRVSLREALSSHLLDWLKRGSLDCAVCYNVVAGPDFTLQSLGDEPRYLIAPTSDKSAPQGGRVSLLQLARLPLILPSHPHATRVMVESRLAAKSLKPVIAAEVDGVSSILSLIRAGYGYGVLPHSALLGAAGQEDLRSIAVLGSPFKSQVSLVTASRRPDSEAQRHVTALLISLMSTIPR